MSHEARGRPDEPRGPLVVAGAPALDRRAFPRPGAVARWFEPFHVRQPQVARAEIAGQVAAGADIVVAPAWLTHRRALEAVGESRRAQAWTAAAVRLAREAVEEGLERRPDGAAGDPVLVAGPLPDIAARPERATGRLLPAAASEERDAHDQAGILADAAVDLLLLEPCASHDATLRSTRVAAETGVPAWVTVPVTEAPGAPPLGERVAMVVASGAAAVLVDVGRRPRRPRSRRRSGASLA
jgi:S-methylmethionine-dependent homocysteine/selenocysteine methylase